MIRTREVQISKPVFHTYDEKIVYESVRIDPQQYIDDFVSRLKGVKKGTPGQHSSFEYRYPS